MDALVTWRWRVVTALAIAVLMMSTVRARPLVGDDEIEAHLNRLKKRPAIKSIELEDREIVDCVDIYEQPAFNNPFMKDHKIITSPSFPTKTINIQPSILQPAWQKSEGCPEGTIPIRRVQKSDLLGASPSTDFGRKDVFSGRVERAGKTLFNDGPYIGTKAIINVWGVSVEPDEWSQVAVELSDGQDKANNKIVLEAGWVVNPRVFGDERTRLYTHWTVDGYNTSGCYNLLCPGFVQMGSNYVLGAVLPQLSTYNGRQFCFNTTIYKDTSNSVWWLLMEDRPVGYWPLCLFKKYGGFEAASTVKWIGSVLNTHDGRGHTTTDMGSGHYSTEGWSKAANIDGIQVMKNIKDGYYQPSPKLALGFADNALCYDFYVDDDGYLFLGGPGRGYLCK